MTDIKKAVERVLSHVAAEGNIKAYVSTSVSETKEFNVDGGTFSLMRTVFGSAVSLTVIEDGKRGSMGINRLDDEALDSLVTDTLAIARAGQSDPAFDIAPFEEARTFTAGCTECDTEKLFDRSKELLDTITARHPKIIMEQMIISHSKTHRAYGNSNGTRFETHKGVYSVDLMFSAHDGDKSTSFFGSGVVTDSLERPFIELGSIERDLSDVEAQLDPGTVDGKFVGTLLLPPGCLGEFLGDIAGTFADDMPLLEGTSVWKDSLGKVVADPRVNIRIDPTDPAVVCGESYTSEGFVSEGYDFIKNGVLESFTLSLYAANKTGLERAKNGSFSLIVGAGDTSLDEIIAGIDRGIIVGRFSGGQPAASGEFSGVAKNSFEIVNGKITRPLSETMISGNLADILKNVRAISSERICDGASVLPYMAFDGVTVSGK